MRNSLRKGRGGSGTQLYSLESHYKILLRISYAFILLASLSHFAIKLINSVRKLENFRDLFAVRALIQQVHINDYFGLLFTRRCIRLMPRCIAGITLQIFDRDPLAFIIYNNSDTRTRAFCAAINIHARRSPKR